MRFLETTTAFRREVKLATRRGNEMSRLKDLIVLLLAGEPLPQRYQDHPLTGEWSGYRDCHIQPDWLLIYRVTGDAVLLARTGTHADLFG